MNKILKKICVKKKEEIVIEKKKTLIVNGEIIPKSKPLIVKTKKTYFRRFRTNFLL